MYPIMKKLRFEFNAPNIVLHYQLLSLKKQVHFYSLPPRQLQLVFPVLFLATY